MFEIFELTFMQRALITGIILAVVLAYLGVLVILRKMSFFADGIAHSSLAGVAIGVLASFYPLVSAIVFSLFMGLLIYYLEEKSRLSSDTIIGIIFSSGLALGAMLMSFKSGYQPELISFLFGNILAISWLDLIVISFMGLLIVSFVKLYYKKLVLISLNEELANAQGVNSKGLKLFFYLSLSMAVVLAIKVLGLILASALLIIPVATAKSFAKSLKHLNVLAIFISIITVFSGLLISYYFNLSTGPSIVLLGALIFFCSLIFKKDN
ncbi:MAG: metal ABC transporter permease [Parcubacteria group bacterium]